MLRPLMLTSTLVLAIALGDAQQPAPPQELSTTWEVPPGDPLRAYDSRFCEDSVLGAFHYRPRPCDGRR